MHNVHHLLNLMKRAREAIVRDEYPAFAGEFFERYFGEQGPPAWAFTALKTVGIDLTKPSANMHV
jgi:hypothetical protein